jgi:hypothetical protein
MTSAQAAMLENALRRASTETGIRDPLDPRLRSARLILARELVAPAESGPGSSAYRLHSAVGFRGLAELHWRYTPFAQSAPAVDEAEAEGIRVFSARVPRRLGDAARFATVEGRGRRLAAARYELTGIQPEHKEGLETIERFRQPALVRLDPAAGGAPVFGAVAGIATAGEITTLDFEVTSGTILPDRATVRLFAAQPVLDEAIDPEGPMEGRLFVPLPGGHAEVFGWWLQTRSAQQAVSSHSPGRRPFLFWDAPPTTEPRAPCGVRVIAPVESGPAYALDPRFHHDWLPTEVNTVHEAEHNPRTVVGWEPYDAVELVGIEVEREERLVDPDEIMLLSAPDLSAWEAVTSIDALPDSKFLESRWIAALATWMGGDRIEAPDTPAAVPILIAASATRRLDASAGLKVVNLPGAPGRAAFIDYFRQAGNGSLAMDGNYEYRYRLVAYIDVGGEDDRFRFLRGRPSGWSDWIRPEPTGAILQPGPQSANEEERATPAVVLEFVPTTIAGQSASLDTAGGWFYRMVVKRELPVSMPSQEGATLKPQWMEVGAPLVLRPDGGFGRVADLRLERSAVDEPLNVKYVISARQVITTPAGRERLVRVLPDLVLAMVIRPSTDPDAREVVLGQLITLI